MYCIIKPLRNIVDLAVHQDVQVLPVQWLGTLSPVTLRHVQSSARRYGVDRLQSNALCRPILLQAQHDEYETLIHFRALFTNLQAYNSFYHLT